MAYVIAEPCIGTKDNSCVEVCPVDCIHPTPDGWLNHPFPIGRVPPIGWSTDP